MSKTNALLISFLVAVMLLGACASGADEQDQAQQVLQDFFGRLSNGEYAEAADLYGGSYETLVSFNPELDPDDHATLWMSGCQINGLQCLAIRTTTYNEVTGSGEYLFTVEFSNPDSSLFIREACCGENPADPPQSQFEFRVVKGGDGYFRVLDMPVYVP